MVLWEVVGGDTCYRRQRKHLQTGLFQRCVIMRRGGGCLGSREQLVELCMRWVMTGVTDYGPGRKVSASRGFSCPCPPLYLRPFLLLWTLVTLVSQM